MSIFTPFWKVGALIANWSRLGWDRLGQYSGESNRFRWSSFVENSLDREALSGLLLVTAALSALFIANSPWADIYQGILALPVSIYMGSIGLEKPLLLWINDGLMALFFLMVGLEVKREVLMGHLSQPGQLVLPAVAALAGIAVPALIYISFTYPDPVASRGWAIPSATDIAFALAIFSLFGKGLPLSLKLFLLSVAIFDDMGAVIIIALFYSQELSTGSLLLAASGLMVLFLLNRSEVASVAAYLLVGVFVWCAVLKSGVHATLAGFMVACFIPLSIPRSPQTNSTQGPNNASGPPVEELCVVDCVENAPKGSMLAHLERALHPWVAFFILPVFAFSNAGINLQYASLDTLFNPVTMGAALGLVVGKQVGIFVACWVVITAGFAQLPRGTSWRQLYGVSVLCGIGFTMSLFVSRLAFETYDASYQISAILGVLIGSLISAIVGSLVIADAKKVAISGQTVVKPLSAGDLQSKLRSTLNSP